MNDDESRAKAGFFRAGSTALWVIVFLIALCPCAFGLMAAIGALSGG